MNILEVRGVSKAFGGIQVLNTCSISMEPGGINPTMVKHLSDRICTLNQRGVTYLVVKHNMEFVMVLCHTVKLLHRGAAIASGMPIEVRKNSSVLEAYLGD